MQSGMTQTNGSPGFPGGFSNAYIEHQNVIDRGEWPDTIDEKENLGLEFSRNVFSAKKLSATHEKETIRFWYYPAFHDAQFVQLNWNSSNYGTAIIKTLPPRDRRGYGSAFENVTTVRSTIYGSDIDLLYETLRKVEFWRTPPGKLAWACTDGVTAIIETNIGGNYRLWANSCYLSDDMETIGKYFEKIDIRETGSAWTWYQ